MVGTLARSVLATALMLAGFPVGADAGNSAAALARSEAAFDGFRQLFGNIGPGGQDLPETTDPAIAAVLAAAWNSDLLWTPDSAEIADLEVLDSICRNGMIIWKTYLFEDIGRLESLDQVLLKRMARYQAEVGLTAPGRWALDRDALLESARVAMAGAPVMPEPEA